MRYVHTIALLLAVSGTSVAAQTPLRPPVSPPSDAQMAAMAANVKKMQHPAEFVLEYKTELNLRADQIAEIEKLVLAQRDSETARAEQMQTAARGNPTAMAGRATVRAMTEWTGAIDEQAIRDEACATSRNTAQYMLAMVRDRHAVGAILTEAQRGQIPVLEAEMMSKAFKKP